MTDLDKIKGVLIKLGISHLDLDTIYACKYALFRYHLVNLTRSEEKPYPYNTDSLMVIRNYTDEEGDEVVEDVNFEGTLGNYLFGSHTTTDLIVKFHNMKLGVFPPLMFNVSEYLG